MALWSLTTPLPLATWQDCQWRLAARTHALHLAGVGDQTAEVREEGSIAWHLRRVCTPDEIAQLTARGLWPRHGGSV